MDDKRIWWVDIPIDMSETEIRLSKEAGKKVCSQYKPLIEKKKAQEEGSLIGSASFIKLPDTSRYGNANEAKILNRIAAENDAVANFRKCIDTIKSFEQFEKAGKYLEYKYFYFVKDQEIIKYLNVSQSTLDHKIKPQAYLLVANWAHQLRIKKVETISFIITKEEDPELFDALFQSK